MDRTLTGSTNSPDGPVGLDGSTERKGWTFGRVAAVSAFVLMAGMWAWLLSPLNDPSHPDELDDQEFLDAAQARCEGFQDQIDGLPNANTAATPADRAPLVDQGTDLTVALVSDLRALAPSPDSEDGATVLQWFADWDIYVADRDAYAENLRGGDTGPFPVTARDGEQISEYINGFAEVNGMVDCVVPLDV